MATRHYESNTSGMNIDRFLDKFDESTLVTMKRHYWTAKQLLRTKLGKKEDEHLLASDASLDSKLTLFRSVRDTSENLLASVENYQAFLLDAILCENELGKYLKEQGKNDKREETGRMMVALGRAMLFSSHQRAAVRVPLIRFYQELHVFAERAIFDCSQTVDAVERARLEYRGSLLWMKKTSEEETRMRDRPVISIENYTIYCGDADENKVEAAEDNSKEAFYDEVNALMSKIPSQQVVIVGIDANAKMGLEQQSDVLGKWYT
ncbi:hypothetical protein RB195_005494 [Necator americanus]|uniref:AH domain-containing protein n=1 Tax=Necator americanus TaxID=51031 RepID=A0ABR1BPR1_NECAM